MSYSLGGGGTQSLATIPIVETSLRPQNLTDKIAYAFQLATAQGPLCHEPVQGVAVFIEEVIINHSNGSGTATPTDLTFTSELSANTRLTNLTGEVIKVVRDSFKAGFLDWSPRLLLAMYSCEIQASSESSTFT